MKLTVLSAALLIPLACVENAFAADAAPAFRIQLDTITEGFEGRPYDAKTMQYMQARGGIVPRAGRDPLVVVTMSPVGPDFSMRRGTCSASTPAPCRSTSPSRDSRTSWPP